MNFDYNEEQRLLADSVRRFVQKDYDFEARKKFVDSAEGYSEKVWGALAQMGLTGIPFSPDHGGFGGGAVDLMSVMEAFGEGLLVEPYLPTLLGARCAEEGDPAAGGGRQAQDGPRLLREGRALRPDAFVRDGEEGGQRLEARRREGRRLGRALGGEARRLGQSARGPEPVPGGREEHEDEALPHAG
jgi:alkylation response protein AidB-like acyl-CoA dehydrogenase